MAWRGLALALASLGTVLTGCAPLPGPPSPEQLAALESRRSESVDDPDALVALAEAYFEADRPDAAIPLLEEAVRADGDNEEALLYLAVSLDHLGRDREARARYQELATDTRSGTVRRAVAERLITIDARLLRAEVQTAVAGAPPPERRDRAIAVLPFVYVGADTSLATLGSGLGQHLAEELVVVDGVTVSDFAWSFAVQHALGMVVTDLPRPDAAVRAGRATGARTLLQGTIDDVDATRLVLRAALVDVATGDVVAQVVAEAPRQLVGVAGSNIAAQAVQALGVDAPLELVDSLRPVPRLESLLAFGRGLDARARGDHREAEEAFGTAFFYTVAWTTARDARDASRELQRVTEIEPFRLAARVNGPTVRAALRERLYATAGGVAPFGIDLAGPQREDHSRATRRKPFAEATGSDGPVRATRTAVKVTIRFRGVKVP